MEGSEGGWGGRGAARAAQADGGLLGTAASAGPGRVLGAQSSCTLVLVSKHPSPRGPGGQGLSRWLCSPPALLDSGPAEQ